MLKETKVGRRNDRLGGQLMLSIPPEWVDDVESALNYLQTLSRDHASRILRELLIAEASRKGWKPASRPVETPAQRRSASSDTA